MSDRAGDEGAFTPGPYHFRMYGQEPEDIALMQRHGMKPTRMLTNEGQVTIMARSGEDLKRIALVDCQTRYKRGEGYRTECGERDANARLIAAAPDLLIAAQAFLALTDRDTVEANALRAAIAKALPARKPGAGHE